MGMKGNSGTRVVEGESLQADWKGGSWMVVAGKA